MCTTFDYIEQIKRKWCFIMINSCYINITLNQISFAIIENDSKLNK